MPRTNATRVLCLVERVKALSEPLHPKPTALPPKLLPLAGIKAVLFDIYGTLFVSGSGDIGTGNAEADEQALRAALSQVGLHTAAMGSTIRGTEFLARAIRQAHDQRRAERIEYPEIDILAIWHRLLRELPENVVTVDVTEDQLRVLALEYECRVNPVWPMPGLAQILSRLHEKRLVLGLVSNAQFYTPLLFEAFLDATPQVLGFDSLCCAFSYQMLEAKPSTRLFSKPLEGLERKYGIKAREVLYVGNDRLKDIWPAQRLGCRTALFAGDMRSLRLREDDERCNTVNPDVVIKDLRQLGNVLS
jgi:putative hydrolase of the HAD superfamily